jgi:hypothetical protein
LTPVEPFLRHYRKTRRLNIDKDSSTGREFMTIHRHTQCETAYGPATESGLMIGKSGIFYVADAVSADYDFGTTVILAVASYRSGSLSNLRLV